MSIPTAPWGVPAIGHGAQLWFRPLEFMTGLNALGPLVRFSPGLRPCYLVTAPELMHRMLVTDARDFVKGRLTDSAGPQIGVSLVMDMEFPGLAPSAAHRRHRRAIQPAFHPHRLAGQVEFAVRATEEGLAAWRPGHPLRLERELLALANRIAAHAFCGEPVDEVAASLSAVQAHLVAGLYWRTVAPLWTQRVPAPGTGGFVRARARLRAAIREALRARRSSPERDDGDVLSALVRCRYPEGGGLDDAQVVREVFFYLVAGAHGVGDVLPWVFHELAAHPEVEHRLHRELTCVLGGRRVGADDLSKLVYTRRVVLEALRRYPPVWLLGRRTIDEMEFGGVRLPAGTDLAWSAYALHHHPEHHRDPYRFDPDRWLPERARAVAPCAHVPFGAGPRRCIGERMAMNQMLAVVATIAARWRLRAVPGGVPVRPSARIFLHPRAMPMVAEPRLSRTATAPRR
ncbi:cytochrome P450 [Streptomyces sp. CT34]|uniref:cytochrome P450 n=1 Tax=Streptomyces sp. CT34 TaxID=1553907 RepID=UPI00068DBC89|nr:cytochrome P450 [Streptomyces sp. CT34]